MPILLEVDAQEFDTILGALRYYADNNMGEDMYRPRWLEKTVTAHGEALDEDGVHKLCDRLIAVKVD